MSLAHLTLATPDVRKAEPFFREALGWRPLSRPNNIGRPAAWLEIAPGLVEVAGGATRGEETLSCDGPASSNTAPTAGRLPPHKCLRTGTRRR
jgi:catechol 2,3-dioxygenase-like lactoylglutathione lyase family enzyme